MRGLLEVFGAFVRRPRGSVLAARLMRAPKFLIPPVAFFGRFAALTIRVMLEGWRPRWIFGRLTG